MTQADSVGGRKIRIGCAGWALAKESHARFPAEGTHLERYAARLPAVEINSSFYRPHQPATYARWAASVPDDFRFSVKVPKLVTHGCRLRDTGGLLDRFLEEAINLGDKLGPLLVQLPPSLPFSSETGTAFFDVLRERFGGDVALEPRHPSWFEPGADRLVASYRVARVAADPAVVPAAAEPGGYVGLIYHRLHGSPRMYFSEYSEDYLGNLAKTLAHTSLTADVWCIFDNTALGVATTNALDLLGLLAAKDGT